MAGRFPGSAESGALRARHPRRTRPVAGQGLCPRNGSGNLSSRLFPGVKFQGWLAAGFQGGASQPRLAVLGNWEWQLGLGKAVQPKWSRE